MEEYLKHWGILGMHWGQRRFQNPDGSLTPEGRKRYGVGEPRKGIESYSDDQLYQLTKRYKNQANYYKAKNDFIKSENSYKELTKPKKKTNEFVNRILVQPFENYLSKSVEFGMAAGTAAFLDSIDSSYADDYVRFVLKGGGSSGKKNDSDDNKSDNRHDSGRKPKEKGKHSN